MKSESFCETHVCVYQMMGVSACLVYILVSGWSHIPKYHRKILLGDFNAKVGRQDIIKPTIGNESLHEISNDNGVRVVNFATSKNRIVKSTMFPHRNIHKYTWTSPDGTCSTNGGEEERGPFRDRSECCGLDWSGSG
jgi:hypothetical protein